MVAPLSTAPDARQRMAATTVGKKPRARAVRPRPRTQRHGEQHPAGAGMPLLATKLTPPCSPFRLVSRSRLLALLDVGVQQLLSLVSAPAGAGKTTLLASWSSAGQPPGPVAWLSLDPGDNQPARFWAYVLAALCRSGAVPANSALQSLAPRPGSDDTFLHLLVSGLAELPTPVVLILDDVQELSDATVLRGLEFLLRHAPPQLRLVLATRFDPPLPLQRLRVSGRLAQIRSADLAFTVAEVADLLGGYEYHPRLSEDDPALLQAHTEGWAAGLRLAALSLQGQPDPHRYVTEFAGDDRSLADYLVGEVLDQQPEEVRSFLLQTCIVEELDGDLADAITDGHDGEWMLAWLERTNAFVAALGSRRGSYRYHQLFAGLLRYELRRQAPDHVAELHRRAARWYAARGSVVNAIRQVLRAEEWRSAADLMAEHGLSLILRGEAATLHELVGRLPTDLAQADPELALLAAADRIVHDDPETAAAHLRLARQRAELLGEDRRARFAQVLAVCSSALAWQVGDLEETLVAGREALLSQARTGVDDAVRAVTLSNLGAAELWTGDLDAAEAHLRDGHAVALGAGLGSLQLACTSQLAVLHVMRGALGQAFRLGSDAVELAARRGWSASAQAAGADLALAWVHYHRDDLVEASHHLDQAAAPSRVRPEWPLTLAVAMLRARLQRTRGDLAGSLATVAAARRDLMGWRPPALLWRWLVLTEAELRSAAGQTRLAHALLEGLDERSPLRAGEAVVLARLHLAEGDPAGATATLAACLDGTAPDGLLSVPPEAWLLDALAGDALADHDRAAASLERALTLAEHEGFRRSFLDAGAPARSLLARYRHRIPASWSYLDELLQASAESARATAPPPPTLIEQLTEREWTVLRYLPSLMTYEEIALDLYVSLNTVKSHVNAIFRKLGVSGRRQAVRSARELHLLEIRTTAGEPNLTRIT
jgi:LuxR family transcriptional regulator, maltose regulon positive regulatory protein